ncbi:DUF4177 domain-containing protein [Nocardioides sp.]|uniref:DUF4177 domain-containing protein n=1 Tax=Nocardioides sp. TaxID=35761 RepID=UPI00261C65F8|nr:DUF4177 domain-containing protein [Nocardioides sp.]
MTTWEYQVAPILNHVAGQILNNFGADGWELVTIVTTDSGNGATQSVGYFKRPVTA